MRAGMNLFRGGDKIREGGSVTQCIFAFEAYHESGLLIHNLPTE